MLESFRMSDAFLSDSVDTVLACLAYVGVGLQQLRCSVNYTISLPA